MKMPLHAWALSSLLDLPLTGLFYTGIKSARCCRSAVIRTHWSTPELLSCLHTLDCHIVKAMEGRRPVKSHGHSNKQGKQA